MGLTSDILEIISDLSGLRGGFNKALVGDERGVCIPIPPGACDRWKVYSQRVTVKAAMFLRGGDVQEINLSLSTEHERLMPVELFMNAQSKIVTALLPEGLHRTRGSRTFRAGWCALLREPVARQALTIQALARAAGSSCRLVRFVSGTPARPDHAVSRDQPGQTSSLRSRNSSLNCQPSKVATIRPSSSQESSLPSTTTIGTP